MSLPVVCLLPARNAAGDISDWLASVAQFADAVVALDDGSTDHTAALLRADPLVAKVLTNPRRDGYAGWDDSANRNRLLAAAAELDPQWIMQLDADERMAADDAHALREFLLHDADPTRAYCFRVYRMVESLYFYDPDPVILGRCFAFTPGQRFPDEELHLVALPTAFPPERWARTTFRIQHLGSLTAEHRRLRYAKYEEADPDRRWQATYEHLTNDPRVVLPWLPRSRFLAPIAHEPQPVTDDDRDHGPAFSAVVIAQNDEATIAESVRAILDQECDDPVEVIVVTSGRDRTAAIVRENFPEVQLIELDHPVLPGEARNVGLRVARGRYVGFPGSHVVMLPGNIAATLHAHRDGYAMVMGSIRNGTNTRAGWANYFLDHSSTLPSRPGGPLTSAPVRASYARAALAEVNGFPEDMRAGEDVATNVALWDRGYSAVRVPEVQLRHDSRARTTAYLLKHHFQRGRSFGQLLADESLRSKRFPTRRMVNACVGLGPVRLPAVIADVYRFDRELARELWASLPHIVAAALSAWLGTLYEVGRRGPALRRNAPPRQR